MSRRNNKKVLLMGQSGAGKTSMRSIIFADHVPSDARQMMPTVEVEHAQVNFLGDMYLNLWDCGGQNLFMNNYFSAQRQNIFGNVAVLIYVIEVKGENPKQEFEWFSNCIKALQEYSPDAKVFCLIHKMDLISAFERTATFEEKKHELRRLAFGTTITCFATSIWDETLYGAWSNICVCLMPGLNTIQQSLSAFMHAVGASEVVLFEKKTFLTVAKEGSEEMHSDPQRFEKVSTIMKHFKLSSAKLQADFSEMEIRNKHFCAFLRSFTTNTLVLVILEEPKPSGFMKMNLSRACKHFQTLEEESMSEN